MKLREETCNECPFRRRSAPGWLGRNKPGPFLVAALSDPSIGCHQLVNQNLAGQAYIEAEAEAPRCRGAAIMRKNQMKEPRDHEAAQLVRRLKPDTGQVFTWQDEFLFHHCAGLDLEPLGNFEIVAQYINGAEAKRTIRTDKKKKARAIMGRLIETRMFGRLFLRHWTMRKGINAYKVLHSETVEATAIDPEAPEEVEA